MKKYSKEHYDQLAKLTGKRRVYAEYWPERLGVVASEGPEYSLVNWDDGTTADRCVLNRLLVTVRPRERLKITRPRRERLRV